MGFGFNYNCKKCRKTFSVFLGIGMLFPTVYKETMQDIRNGKYGKKWKELLDSEQYTAVDAEKYFYRCDHCGNWATEKGLDIYAPKDPDAVRKKQFGEKTVEELGGVPYVMDWELLEEYKLLEPYVHECSKCGKEMRRIPDGKELNRELSRLACPNCGELTEREPVFWD